LANALVIKQGNVLLADGSWRQCDVLLQDGKIAGLGNDLSAPQQYDMAGALVLPGLIDLHIHGICIASVETATLQELSELEAERGATCFFPTFFGPPQITMELLRRHRLESQELAATPQIGGFRLESPYLAATGAGIETDLAPISPELTERLLVAGGRHIRIWDISPELPGAPEAIRQLSQSGIICSIAHTHCSIAQAREAVEAGARLVTHLFDTFTLPDAGAAEPGVYPAGLTDYLLVEDRLVCEIIGDGTHVHPLLVEKALRCKTAERIAFVTDSNLGAGLPSGRYTTPKWGEIEITGPNNGARLAGRNMELAGSALTPIDSFRNAVNLFGKSIAAASRLCATTPACLLGLNKGEIAIGKDADLIVLSPELALLATICAGKIVHQSD
jgi:N-acetylglucosamine-6-phosphate deacetylase